MRACTHTRTWGIPARTAAPPARVSNVPAKKSLALVPKDNRIYREEVIKDVLQAHTF